MFVWTILVAMSAFATHVVRNGKIIFIFFYCYFSLFTILSLFIIYIFWYFIGVYYYHNFILFHFFLSLSSLFFFFNVCFSLFSLNIIVVPDNNEGKIALGAVFAVYHFLIVVWFTFNSLASNSSNKHSRKSFSIGDEIVALACILVHGFFAMGLIHYLLSVNGFEVLKNLAL